MKVYCPQWEEIVNGVDSSAFDLEYPPFMCFYLFFGRKRCFDIAFFVSYEDL